MNAHVELTKRGFKKEGNWTLGTTPVRFDHNINPTILNNTCFLYAFVINNIVMYIGKSYRTVGQRMNDYALNKSNSFQGKHVNGLRQAIHNNVNVEIYLCFPQIEVDYKVKVKDIDHEVTKDDVTRCILDSLEKKIIREFQNGGDCIWNTQIQGIK